MGIYRFFFGCGGLLPGGLEPCALMALDQLKFQNWPTTKWDIQGSFTQFNP